MSFNDIMTLEEVAEYLRISERTVKEWVTQGKLPGGKLGTSWRFQRNEIENWVSQKLSPRIKTVQSKGITGLLSPDRVLFLDVKNKNMALNALIDVAQNLPGVHSREELVDAVYKRESLMSTGIGLGIGVPHVRLNDVKDLYLSLAVTKDAIVDYESLDDVPVKIIVFIVAGRNQHSQYIQVLSKIAKLMKNPEVREQLVHCTHADQIFELLKNKEF
ncbi:MAG: PTS sugar transporter subunit IIA [Candidatus Marinimicrobia bacterium]|nr:PTS sugar transporter subunit IIA [Candidatus Neomarinimicrobiota bacterium]